MTAYALLWAALFAASTQPTGAPSPADPIALHNAQQEVFREAVARAAPYVVTIETIGGTQPGGGGPTSGPGMPGPRGGGGPGFIVADGPTTGIIYSAEGHILTSAFNFVRNPSLITVILPDGRRFIGELLARDEVRQLAMVKIDARGLPVPTWVAEPAQLRVGQWAIALGRGFGGKEPSLSAGIISGLNRQAGLAVQTDAKLSPANFGGPLIDLDGRIIGLNVPMGMHTGEMAGVELYDSGIGFAVPAWQVTASARDLAVGHNLRRGMMGVAIDSRERDAVVVLGVADPSPGLRSGMQRGDRIVAIDGKPVTDYPSMQRLLRPRLAGERITVRIRRAGEELDLRLILAVPEDIGEIPRPATEPAETQPERP